MYIIFTAIYGNVCIIGYLLYIQAYLGGLCETSDMWSFGLIIAQVLLNRFQMSEQKTEVSYMYSVIVIRRLPQNPASIPHFCNHIINS